MKVLGKTINNRHVAVGLLIVAGVLLIHHYIITNGEWYDVEQVHHENIVLSLVTAGLVLMLVG